MEFWKLALTSLCCLSMVPDALSTCPNCGLEQTDPVLNPYRWNSVIRRIWGRNSSRLSNLGIEFVSYVRAAEFRDFQFGDNIEAKILNFHRIASYPSVLMNHFMPYLDQQPSICGMVWVLAAIIFCKSEFAVEDAMAYIRETYLYDIIPRLERTIAHQAGCDFHCGKYPPDPRVWQGNCMKDFAYVTPQIINQPRFQNLPPGYKDLLLRLAASGDYTDNVIGVCAMFTLIGGAFEALPNYTFLEATELTLSGPIHPSCCYQRITRADEIREFYEKSLTDHITQLRKNIYAQC